MPLLLLAPVILIALMAIGVRGRRASANVALFGILVMAATVAAIAYARALKDGAYDASYTWLSLTLSFQGATQFQSYTPAVALRVNHINLLLLAVALAVSLGAVTWSRSGARSEPALTRYYGLQLLLVFAAVGVILNVDLVALYAFWGLGGVASYLLLTHNWGDDRGTRGARLALALPIVGDLALLAGIALLYSRYGNLNLDALIPVLKTTPGAGPKALTTAAILLITGAGIRVGLFPFQGWVTAAVDAPPGAAAAVNGLWPVMASALMYKVLPILVAWTGAPPRVLAVAAAVSALLLPLSALVTDDIRRIAANVGVALSALGLLAFARPGLVGPAAIALAASGPARAGLTIAVAALVNNYRSAALGEIGDAWRRMRQTVLGVAVAVAGLALVPGQAAGGDLKWWWFAAYGAGLALAMLAAARLLFAPALVAIPRRRGFDPNRVREAPGVMTGSAILLGLAAAVVAASSFSTRWLTWVDTKAHQHPPAWATALWLVIPAAALLLGYLVFVPGRAATRRLAGRVAYGWGFALATGAAAGERFLAAPAFTLAQRTDDVALEAGEARVGAELAAAAWLTRARVPLLSLALGVAMLVAVAAALFAPGVHR